MPNEKIAHIKLIGICEHCGKEVDVTLTKREVKTMMKAFSLPPERANILLEKILRKEEWL